MSTQKTIKANKKTSEQSSIDTAGIVAGSIVSAQLELQATQNSPQKLVKQLAKRDNDLSDSEIAASDDAIEVQASDVSATVIMSGLFESADSDVSLVANDRNCRVNSKGEEQCESGTSWWLGALGLGALAAAAGGGGGGGGSAPAPVVLTVENYRHADFDSADTTLLLSSDNDADIVNVVLSEDENLSTEEIRSISFDDTARIADFSVNVSSDDEVMLSLDLSNASEIGLQTVSVFTVGEDVGVTGISTDGISLVEFSADNLSVDVAAAYNASIFSSSDLVSASGDNLDVSIEADLSSYIYVCSDIIYGEGINAELDVVASLGSAVCADDNIVEWLGDGANVTILATNSSEIDADNVLLDLEGDSASVNLTVSDDSSIESFSEDLINVSGDLAEVNIFASGDSSEIITDSDILLLSGDDATVSVEVFDGALIEADDEVVQVRGDDADVTILLSSDGVMRTTNGDAIAVEGDNANVTFNIFDNASLDADDEGIEVDGILASVDVQNDNAYMHANGDMFSIDGDSAELLITGVSGAYFSADDDLIENRSENAFVSIDLADSFVWAVENMVDLAGDDASIDLVAVDSEIRAINDDLIRVESDGDRAFVSVDFDSSDVRAFDGDVINVSGDNAEVELQASNGSYIEGQDIVYVRGGDSLISNSTITVGIDGSDISADSDLVDVERSDVTVDILISADSVVSADGSILEAGIANQSDYLDAGIDITESVVLVSGDMVEVDGDSLDLVVEIESSYVTALEDLINVIGDSSDITVSVDGSGPGPSVYALDDFLDVNGQEATINLDIGMSADVYVGVENGYDLYRTENGSNLIQLEGQSGDVEITVNQSADVYVQNHVALIDGDDLNLTVTVSEGSTLQNSSSDDAIQVHGKDANIEINVNGDSAEFTTSGDIVQFESSYIGGESNVTINATQGASVSADDDVLYSFISFDVDSIEDIQNATSATFNFAVNANSSADISGEDNVIDIFSESYSQDATFTYRENTYSYDDVLSLPVEVNVSLTVSEDASVYSFGDVLSLFAGESEYWNVSIDVSGSADVGSSVDSLIDFNSAGNGSYAGTHSIDVSITDESYVYSGYELLEFDNLENSYVGLVVDDSYVDVWSYGSTEYWVSSDNSTSTTYSVDIGNYEASGDDIGFYIEGEDNTLNLSIEFASIDDVSIEIDALDDSLGDFSTISIDTDDVSLYDLSIDVSGDIGRTAIELTMLDTDVSNDISIVVLEGAGTDIGIALTNSYVDDDLTVYATPESEDSNITLVMDDSYVNGTELYFDCVDTYTEISMEMNSSEIESGEIIVDGIGNSSFISAEILNGSLIDNYLDIEVYDFDGGSSDIDFLVSDSSVDNLNIYVSGDGSLDILLANIDLVAQDSSDVTNTYIESRYATLSLDITANNDSGDAWAEDDYGIELNTYQSTVYVESYGVAAPFVEITADYSNIHLGTGSIDVNAYLDVTDSILSNVYGFEDNSNDFIYHEDGAYAVRTLDGYNYNTPGGEDNDYWSYTLTDTGLGGSSSDNTGNDLYLVMDSTDLTYMDDGYEVGGTISEQLQVAWDDVYFVVLNTDTNDTTIYQASGSGWSDAHVIIHDTSSFFDATNLYSLITDNSVINPVL